MMFYSLYNRPTVFPQTVESRKLETWVNYRSNAYSLPDTLSCISHTLATTLIESQQ